MAPERTPDAVLRAVEELGLFQAPRRPAEWQGSGRAALEGEVLVQGHVVTLQLVLGPTFPLVLPTFLLRPWDALGFIPHVAPDGVVCFADKEGLLLDRRRPIQLVEDAFHRAVGVLADGVTGKNRSDFVEELEWYWRQLRGGIAAYSVFDPCDKLGRVTIAFTGDQRPAYIAASKQEISDFCNGSPVSGTFQQRGAIYVPLEPGTIFSPPRPDRLFWTVEEARRVLLPGLSRLNRARLRRLLNERTHPTEYVIVRLPRPSGGATVFGLQYEGVGKHHPLHERGTAERVLITCEKGPRFRPEKGPRRAWSAV